MPKVDRDRERALQWTITQVQSFYSPDGKITPANLKRLLEFVRAVKAGEIKPPRDEGQPSGTVRQR
jgi:hypothetical protein